MNSSLYRVLEGINLLWMQISQTDSMIKVITAVISPAIMKRILLPIRYPIQYKKAAAAGITGPRMRRFLFGTWLRAESQGRESDDLRKHPAQAHEIKWFMYINAFSIFHPKRKREDLLVKIIGKDQ